MTLGKEQILDTTEFLRVSSSVIFFAQKILVLTNRKSGWLVGIVAATLALFYFYQIGLLVYTTLEVGLITLMCYGFFKKESQNVKVEDTIRCMTLAIMAVLTCFVFTGMMTVVELFGSACLLVGIYLLTHSKPALGWFISGIGHSITAFIGYSVPGQQFFADFQVATVVVCAVGVHINKEPR